jgi:branched-chain amino acid transport system ATP-binding protein
MPAVLRVTGLNVQYGALVAAQDIALEVHRGEIVSLLGPNGAGKTSVLRAVMGLVPHTRGTVEFFDGATLHRLDTLPTHRLAALGIASVPSLRIVLPRMTVEENLEVGALFLRRDAAALARERDRLCEIFPVLGRRRRALAATLSGGEQRMLAIARALMARPRLLLLDEPSLGLAPLVLNEIFAMLQRINAEGDVDVLLVEQNVKKALEISHRAYVMRIGALDFEGPSREILASGRLESAYLG